MRELSNTEWLREFQRKLHEKAKAEPKFRFYSLYDKTYRMEVLEEAYGKAKSNGGTTGIDGESFEEIEEKGLSNYLQELQGEMKERRYVPPSQCVGCIFRKRMAVSVLWEYRPFGIASCKRPFC